MNDTPIGHWLDALESHQAKLIEKHQPSECDQCGKDYPEGHVVWLEGPYGTGQWLCKKHYEQELTEGRGRR